MSNKDEKIKKRNSSLDEKNSEMRKKTQMDLAYSMGKVIVYAKTVGHVFRELPKAISKRNEIKKEGKNPEDIFEYIEEPEFEWGEEITKTATDVYMFFYKLDKKLYEMIKNRKIRKLPEGKGEEIVDENKGKKEFLKELSKNTPTLEEQKENSEKIMQKFEESEPIKTNIEKEI